MHVNAHIWLNSLQLDVYTCCYVHNNNDDERTHGPFRIPCFSKNWYSSLNYSELILAVKDQIIPHH